MIRNDGKEFPVDIHLYTFSELAECFKAYEALQAAEWDFNATSHKSVQKLILEFINAWGASLPGGDVDIISPILDCI